MNRFIIDCKLKVVLAGTLLLRAWNATCHADDVPKLTRNDLERWARVIREAKIQLDLAVAMKRGGLRRARAFCCAVLHQPRICLCHGDEAMQRFGMAVPSIDERSVEDHRLSRQLKRELRVTKASDAW
jgi:hypothetical protein